MKRYIILLLICISIFLCGCKSKSTPVSDTTLEFLSDGSIRSTVVEDFDEDYYSLEEMKQMIDGEISSYNQTAEGNVSMLNCEVQEGNAVVLLTFRYGDDYAKFNNSEFYYGPVKGAIDKGYGLNAKLKNVLGDNIVNNNNLADFSDYHMIVMKEHVYIKTYGPILYASSNIQLTSENEAYFSSDSDSFAYIIVK